MQGAARLNVRIPADLDTELEIAVAKKLASSKQEATVEALTQWLAMAGKEDELIAQKSHQRAITSDDSLLPASEDSTVSTVRRNQSVIQIDYDIGHLTDQERKVCERVIGLYRAGSDHVRQALMSNLVVFEEADLYDRQRLTDAPKTPASEQDGTRGVDEAIARAKRVAARTEQILSHDDKSQKRPTRKAGGRR